MDRRRLLSLAALGPVGALAPGRAVAGPEVATSTWQDGGSTPPHVPPAGRPFLSDAERVFVTAAVDRLIPPDLTGPSASEAGVPEFIDRQLAGPFGQGAYLYLGGPWPKGTPSQGFQGRLAPGAMMRAGIAAFEAHIGRSFGNRSFAKLTPEDQDKTLQDLESGKIVLGDGIDGHEFFSLVLLLTKEGYLSDPIYGGNRDMAAWRMIGFPGARYDYGEWVSRHGDSIPYEPTGLLGRAAQKGS